MSVVSEAEPNAADYLARPWRLVRPTGGPTSLVPKFGDLLTAYRSTVRRAPTAVAIRYFDAALSYAELDELSDGFAAWLTKNGVTQGDRVMVILQNVPQFAIAVLGAWKCGAVPTPSNPMYRPSELATLFSDCVPSAVVCQNDHLSDVRAGLRSAACDCPVLTTSPFDLQTRDDMRVLPPGAPTPAGEIDFLQCLRERTTAPPPANSVESGDLGLLLYTSGTTGVPKGVMLSHGALAYNAEVSVEWFMSSETGRLLSIAPLFHITGFTVHFAAALISGGELLLTYRFHPEAVLDAMLEHRPTLMVAAITAFIALMNSAGATPQHFSSFRRLYSGGAPIPPAIVDAFEARFGQRIHTSFGMTETSAPTHIAPWGSAAPTDPETGALAIGVPVSGVDAIIVGAGDAPMPVGQSGELLVRGPQLMDGYWNRPDETASALANGWMHTGDVGFMDREGWFYLIDRKKDLINASGFKVSPREVEDVLYRHPAVREAAVIGVLDSYRGETVKAVVSLKAGAVATAEELIAHCREFLAAYKAPRQIELIGDLPKTVSGKVMRAALRDR